MMAHAFSDKENSRGIDSLAGKDLFIRAYEGLSDEDIALQYDPDYKILKTEREDNKAILHIENSKSQFREVLMVLENDHKYRKWKSATEGGYGLQSFKIDLDGR